MKKLNKSLLVFGTVFSIVAPSIAIVSCTKSNVKDGGVFSVNVLEHDLLLSLGIAPQYHQRSDISSANNILNEGYLEDFAGSTTIMGNAHGDKEYFQSLKLGLYVSKPKSDVSIRLKDASRKFDSIKPDDFGGTPLEGTALIKGGNNPDAGNLAIGGSSFEFNWIKNEENLSKMIDKITGEKTYETRTKLIEKQWDTRSKILQEDASNKLDKPLNVLLVRGVDDSKVMWNGIMPKGLLSELYGLDNINFASPDGHMSQIKYALGGGRPYLIQGRNSNTNKVELENAFAGTADIVVYLETPKAKFNDDQKEKVKKSLKKMLNPKNSKAKILMRKWDDWGLPFQGAAIGSNVAMDNIERDIIGNTSFDDSSWKETYSSSNLKSIYLPNE